MNALSIEDLGKRYRISRSDAEDSTFSPRDFVRGVKNVFHRGEQTPRTDVREFWALRNVTFDVPQGSILGIIGANGAGKSTLLKILARVVVPTEGRATGFGRVVSLLELGAGFNPELSARENVLMNAALNGFSRSEALARFDAIIEFAEMEDFVDSPLKFYSSGMYLRLAFSVAVNMQPRILLADEILAVGDLTFQERCLNHVANMGKEGLTVLFVSHDMDAIMRVCNRVIWLDEGKLVKDGDPEAVVTEYQNVSWSRADVVTSERGRSANRWAEIMAVRLVSESGKEVGAPAVDKPFRLRIRFRARRKRIFLRFGADFSVKRQLLFRAMSEGWHEIEKAGVYEAYLDIPAHFLAEINYNVGVTLDILRDGKEYILVNYSALTFMAYSAGETKIEIAQRKGLVAPRFQWTVQRASNAS
jgi:lipopolysaccharide transport system ATP-binding protein